MSNIWEPCLGSVNSLPKAFVSYKIIYAFKDLHVSFCFLSFSFSSPNPCSGSSGSCTNISFSWASTSSARFNKTKSLHCPLVFRPRMKKLVVKTFSFSELTLCTEEFFWICFGICNNVSNSNLCLIKNTIDLRRKCYIRLFWNNGRTRFWYDTD